ncbi:MAG: DUF1573 domain-containing protein [Thermodesulfobacteriota bacterium]
MSKAKTGGEHKGKRQFRLERKWVAILALFILSLGFTSAYGIAKFGGGGRAKVESRTAEIQGLPSPGVIVSGTPAPHEAAVNFIELYEKLNCECGNCDSMLAKCECKTAKLMKDRITSLKQEQRTENEILDWMVDRYGLKVLASKSGRLKRQPPPGMARPVPRGEAAAALSTQKGFSHAKENSPPRIEVIPETYNFGRIPPKKVSHTFSVENIGESTLEIYHVSTSCGCTTASTDRRMIEPGETAKVIVNFDPALHRSFKKGEVVPMRRSIYIRSNDPKTPEKTVFIIATVIGGG